MHSVFGGEPSGGERHGSRLRSRRAGVAHDAYPRLLHRLEPEAATWWQEARSLVTATSGVLVLDDTTLD